MAKNRLRISFPASNGEKWKQVAERVKKIGPDKSIKILSGEKVEEESPEDKLEKDFAFRALRSKLKDKEQIYSALVKKYDKLKGDFDDFSTIKGSKINENVLSVNLTNNKKDTLIPILILSDFHIEEIVTLGSTGGLNEYNLDIAEKRMYILVNNFLNEIENKRKFTTIDSLVVGLLGDAIGGLIHDELRETNECSAIDAIIKAKEILINCINTIIDKGNFDKITFLCNRGNHSRISHKMTYSNESAQSLETFLYVSLKDYYRSNENITFEIPESGIGYFTIKNHTLNENFILRFLHGWQIKSNGGIGGITIPLNKYIYKLDETRKANHTILGHFHNLSYPSLNITLNGSVKGMDAFAVQHGFSYQRPMQGLIYYSVKDNAINERTIIYCDK